MFHPEKKYPSNSGPTSGFRASGKLNAAVTQALQDAQAQSGGAHDAAVRLNEHPQLMRLFLSEFLEQLNKGR